MSTSRGGAEWKRLPPSGDRIRFSKSKNAWIYEDGSLVPKARLEKPVVERPVEASSVVPPLLVRQTTADARNRSSSRKPAGPDAEFHRSVARIDLNATSGVKTFTARLPETGLSTLYEISPPVQTLGPLFRQKRLRGTGRPNDGRRVKLAEDYGYSRDPVSDFPFGRVIEMLLVPPEEGGYSHLTPHTGYSHASSPRMRRFVVIKASTAKDHSFQALPIKTYNGYGVAREIKSHHSITYTRRHRGDAPPQPTREEIPRRLPNGTTEQPMQQPPIRVTPYDPARPLDPMSRLHYFDVHEFDGDVDNIKLYGDVHEDSLAALYGQYVTVQSMVRRVFHPNPVPPADNQRQAPPRDLLRNQNPPRNQNLPRTTAAGEITVAELRRIEAQIHGYADSQGYETPAVLSDADAAQLAQDQALRETWRQGHRRRFATAASSSGDE